ncbi:hypothetical protein IDAT_05210 [Pseudidiomarina atlantica]|uniref:Uncharacterized protein n=1 Tax=Pseudidiomarina atlantica TaxID=1517416 RepID=A0A094IPM4_9GAMM|nr:hypothetical protein [Pseudidiomarina atlantica]KFZ29077.1 hypothetical protein IDAT_05210 [Pseudidiomarina atlantica]
MSSWFIKGLVFVWVILGSFSAQASSSSETVLCNDCSEFDARRLAINVLQSSGPSLVSIVNIPQRKVYSWNGVLTLNDKDPNRPAYEDYRLVAVDVPTSLQSALNSLYEVIEQPIVLNDTGEWDIFMFATMQNTQARHDWIVDRGPFQYMISRVMASFGEFANVSPFDVLAGSQHRVEFDDGSYAVVEMPSAKVEPRVLIVIAIYGPDGNKLPLHRNDVGGTYMFSSEAGIVTFNEALGRIGVPVFDLRWDPTCANCKVVVSCDTSDPVAPSCAAETSR